MYFDIIVIGSGPGSYAASIRSSQLGMKTAIIVEKSSLICKEKKNLDWSYVPSKIILDSIKKIKLYKEIKELFNVKSEKDKVGFSEFILMNKKIVKKINENILLLMKKNNVHIIYADKINLKKNKKINIINDNISKEYNASNIIISIKSIPKINENIYKSKNIITYHKDILNFSKVPNKMIIIGSKSKGLEFSSFYHFFGTKITIIEPCSSLFPNGDHDISEYLRTMFEKMGINIYLSSEIEKIEKFKNDNIVVYIKNIHGERIKLISDVLFYDSENVPNTKSIGLNKIGIQEENGFIVVDKSYKTNINGYYAIGDSIKTPSSLHTSFHEAISCIEGIKGLNYRRINYENIPKCVYSYPEISYIGYTEKESIKKGFKKLKVAKVPFNLYYNLSISDKDGFVKVIFDEKYDEWIGCHMIGNNVTELISEVVVARNLETTGYEILNSIHPSYSLSKSISEAVESAYGKSIFKT